MADQLTRETRSPAIASGGDDPGSPPTDVAVVDCQDLIARCMGNLAFAEKILGKFRQRLDEDLACLESEIDEPDAQGIARVAHRLKGASANVSANGLHGAFSRLEELARAEQLQDLPRCMDELRAECSRFKQAQNSLFASSNDNPEQAVE